MPSPQTFFVDEIEVGQNYELIFSQRYGLYRYRFGDVIKVSGFYKNCPKVKFLYRKATLLNLVGEKVDQTTILEAIQASLSRWANTVELSYYTVAENTLLKELHEGEAGSGNTYLFYVLFLELKMNASGKFPQDLQPHTLAQIIDRQIYENHTFYRNFKDTDQIALPRVYFVKTGAFLQLKEFILQTTSSSRSQFKMPLKLRTSKMAEIMLANVMH
ncbi:Indole-3-acetic acid-amido synthetase GH3.17 [Holothuria leucospilota]|uniref:Indole-3-acetic acid-amido synthetase GH3.17 n=1 Tax=Holothuria leucospilota TaxID=206669 RepID=A0A9Q1HAD9_HOLLE|nr:Indole-3-acetic acid-amido synthetase GH3.17 [Holothuria leucospilota]